MEKEQRDDFMGSVNEGARNQETGGWTDDLSTQGSASHKNLEILPIQELRKEAENLGIEHIEHYNKQELIEQIHRKNKG